MQKKFEFIGFLVGWFAIIAQFVLILQNRQADIPETIIRFFSFFTILTNILVAIFFTSKLFPSVSNKITFFQKNGTLTAITTFILIVGLVYQFVLREIWEPQGMQRVVDELLHTFIPLFALLYWFLFSTKEKAHFREVVIWLIYPILYLLFVLTRGHFSNYYPYPFLNIKKLGIGQVALNALLILLLILGIMSLLVFVKKKPNSIKKLDHENS